MQKIRLLLIVLASSFVLASCNAPGGSGSGFIDQPLQGKIGGVSWLYVSGTAEYKASFGEIWLTLYDISPNGADPWAGTAYLTAQDKMLFKVPASVGLRELSWSQTVTLYDKSSGTNYICVEGAVEILTIDAVGGTLTGRIDVRFDSDNSVNGNFSAAYR